MEDGGGAGLQKALEGEFGPIDHAVGITEEADSVVWEIDPWRHRRILAGIVRVVAPLVESGCKSDGYSVSKRRISASRMSPSMISPRSGISR